MDPLEQSIQSELTDWFISADSVEIPVYRAQRLSDGSGGFKDVYPSVPTHTAVGRMIPQQSETSTAAKQDNSSDGERRDPRYILLANVGEDFAVTDILRFDDELWRIRQRHQPSAYQQKFDVVKYAGR